MILLVQSLYHNVAFIDKQGVVVVESDQVLSEVISDAIYDEPKCVSSPGTALYLEPIRELPPIPDECDTLPADYLNDNDHTAADEVFSKTDDWQIDSGISSNVIPSSEVETPYNRLETSTREPPTDPSDYNNLTKPENGNANIEAIEMTNDKVDDEAQSGSGMCINGSAASQV